MEISYSNSEIT